MTRKFVILLFIFFTFSAVCQQNLYSFGILNNSNSAKVAALGGYPTAAFEDDPSTGVSMPSNLTKENSGQVVINYLNHFADTDQGMISYSHHFKELGVFSSSLIFCNYGKFDYSDPNGVFNGSEFGARDLMTQIGYSKKIFEKFQIGFNLKFVSSVYEQYNASALGFDVSTTYFNKENQFGGSLLVQNLGRSLNTFSSNTKKEDLPSNIQISVNKKLSYSPIRFHIIYHDLQTWNNKSSSSNNSNRLEFLTENFLNHVVLASEFLFSENFNFRIGYNFKNRMDLQPISRAGGIGFSWGVGLRIKKLNINYSYSRYHFSGNSNNLTIIRRITK
tara:strand:- start:2096 stop:3091 length:996 start_codon:yes stop_codon:yes gene_type:complete